MLVVVRADVGEEGWYDRGCGVSEKDVALELSGAVVPLERFVELLAACMDRATGNACC